MTAGHFGLAAAIKSRTPKTPLWALMLATYLLDVFFIVLVSAGIEGFRPMDPGHPAYGGAIIDAGYSHSLVGAAIIAIVAGLVAAWAWNRTAGWIIGGVVFSHWILDLIVHRPDMPILPGNAGGFPMLGLGLWNYPVLSALLELLIVLVGAWLYFGSASETARDNGSPTSKATMAAGVTASLLVLLLATDYFSVSLMLSIMLMLALIVLCGWLDSRLRRPSAA